MDNGNNQMTATFSSHYGAMLTKRVLGQGCALRPVPRSLSSSCGTCAVIEGHTLNEIVQAAGEYLEAVYNETKGGYVKVYGYSQAD